MGCRRASALLLSLSVLAAACSSTTREQVSSGFAAETGFEVASGDVGLTGDGFSADASSSSGLGVPGSAGSTRGAGVRGSAGGGSASGSAGGGGPIAMGQGVTATEMLIGIEAAADINRSTAAVGAATSNPEEGDVAQAVVDYLNARGGIAGRKIVPVFSEKDAIQGTWETHAQQSCSRFTEDAKVFVAIDSSVGGNDSLASCLAQRGVPLVEQNYWPFDADAYRRIGRFVYQPGRMMQERWVPSFIDGLVAMGFFGDGAKIGIIRFDQPVFQRMADGMRARLAKHGRTVTAEAATITPHGVGDFGQMGAQIGNALVDFQSKGVTHVLMAEYNGQLPFFFLPAADSQGYKPVYGFHSNNLPNTQVGGQAPQQLVGSMVVGWMPPNDVADVDEYRGGNYARCQDIGKDSGGSERGRRLYVSYYCESLLFLKAALDQATALTPDGLEDAVNRLGTGFDSPFTYATSFFPGRHDGATAVRYSRFDEGCECYRYANDRIDRVG